MPDDRLQAEWEELGRPVFRPSLRRDWKRCPAFADLKRNGGRLHADIRQGGAFLPRMLQWEPWQILGTAVTAGQAHFYKGGTRPDAHKITADILTTSMSNVESVEYPLATVLRYGKRALDAALDVGEGLIQGRNVLLVDPDHTGPHPVLGPCHPDLLLESQQTGDVVVVDNKLTGRLDPKWQYTRLTEMETDDQWWHYAWAVTRFMKRQVQVVGGLVSHVTAVTPSLRSFTHAWDCEPHVLAAWEREAIRDWVQMERERLGEVEPTWRLSGCHAKVGRCPYYDLHFTYRDKVGGNVLDYYYVSKVDEVTTNAGEGVTT